MLNRDKYVEHPLCSARKFYGQPIRIRNGHVEIVRLLANSAQSADAGALHIAARKGHVEAGIQEQ